MNSKNNQSDFAKKLLDVLLTIVGILIALVDALFTFLKAMDWKGLISGAKDLFKDFSKANALHFLKTNKKTLFVLIILLAVVSLISDSLFYRPVDMGYGYDRDYSYSDYGYSGYSDDDCKNCYGTGDCPFCNGSGIYRSYGLAVECQACDHYGNCSSCGGDGKR